MNVCEGDRPERWSEKLVRFYKNEFDEISSKLDFHLIFFCDFPTPSLRKPVVTVTPVHPSARRISEESAFAGTTSPQCNVATV